MPHKAQSLSTTFERPPLSTSTSPSSAATITVKLRNEYTTPPQTKSFTLPRARALQTSAYLRAHISLANDSSPRSPSKNGKDGVIRLNFPDFEIFEIYVEWLHSGEVFTKAALRALHSLDTDPPHVSLEHKARRAYTDYLGGYFLGTWLRDIAFKDNLVSLIIDRINGEAGYPKEFLRALKPGIVDLVTTDENATGGIRRLMFAAIVRWGDESDVAKLLPMEGYTCGRSFLRGLLRWLLLGVQQKSCERGEGHGIKNDKGGGEEVEPTWASTSKSTLSPTEIGFSSLPPPFMPCVEKIWIPAESSSISWPTTHSSAQASSRMLTLGSGGSGATSGTSLVQTGEPASSQEEFYVEWPEMGKDHCMFHEHTYPGLPCYMKMAGWDIGEQGMCYGDL